MYEINEYISSVNCSTYRQLSDCHGDSEGDRLNRSFVSVCCVSECVMMDRQARGVERVEEYAKSKAKGERMETH